MERLIIEPGYARKNRQVIGQLQGPYLKQKGWTMRGTKYEGCFRTKYGSWPGRISYSHERLEFQIYTPPEVVLDGEHGACFNHTGKGWWSVHWSDKPENASDGILAIERAIEASYLDPGTDGLQFFTRESVSLRRKFFGGFGHELVH